VVGIWFPGATPIIAIWTCSEPDHFSSCCALREQESGVGHANWLLAPATPHAAHRQRAVPELCDRIGLQEGWAAVEGTGLRDVDAGSIHEWMNAPAAEFPRYA
jgi:hypothetical protein